MTMPSVLLDLPVLSVLSKVVMARLSWCRSCGQVGIVIKKMDACVAVAVYVAAHMGINVADFMRTTYAVDDVVAVAVIVVVPMLDSRWCSLSCRYCSHQRCSLSYL